MIIYMIGFKYLKRNKMRATIKKWWNRTWSNWEEYERN